MATIKAGEATTITLHFMQFSGLDAAGLTVTGALYREGAATAVATGIAMPVSAADATAYVATLAATYFVTPGKYYIKAVVTDNAAAIAVENREQTSDTFDVAPAWVLDIASILSGMISNNAGVSSTLASIIGQITAIAIPDPTEQLTALSTQLSNAVTTITSAISALPNPSDALTAIAEQLTTLQLSVDTVIGNVTGLDITPQLVGVIAEINAQTAVIIAALGDAPDPTDAIQAISDQVTALQASLSTVVSGIIASDITPALTGLQAQLVSVFNLATGQGSATSATLVALSSQVAGVQSTVTDNLTVSHGIDSALAEALVTIEGLCTLLDGVHLDTVAQESDLQALAQVMNVISAKLARATVTVQTIVLPNGTLRLQAKASADGALGTVPPSWVIDGLTAEQSAGAAVHFESGAVTATGTATYLGDGRCQVSVPLAVAKVSQLVDGEPYRAWITDTSGNARAVSSGAIQLR
jgi:hypothetical protein